jgi:signal transduction histidine kinase
MRRTLISSLVIVLGILLAALLVLQERNAREQLQESIREENWTRLTSSVEHVREYFESVYSLLLFISLDEYVSNLERTSRPYIQKLFEHSLEKHKLTEVYVVEAGFRGERQPFMTFEPDSPTIPLKEIHSSEREQEEYQVQIEHLKRFGENPKLKALMSTEISLCTPDEQSGRARGFVYSVPIWSEGRLVGLVAGMLEKDTVLDVLREGLTEQVVALVSQAGDIFLDRQAPPGLRAWLEERTRSEGAGAADSIPKGASRPEGWDVLSSGRASVAAGQKWRVVYFYKANEPAVGNLVFGTLGRLGLPGTILFATFALAALVWTLHGRLEQEQRHLRERKELERQVQEVSEREQRRIGEVLHEDLCQRLTGIDAVAKVLGKKLASEGAGEAAIASELSSDVKEALHRARETANELKPIALLQEGFVAAMQKLTRHTANRSGVACRLEADNLPEIDESLGTHLYRIAQEALNNVVRHAQATQAVVRLEATEERLVMSITDDGRSIGDGHSRSGGMGLRIMGYRSDLIQADLNVSPAPGKGTVVTCSVPISSAPGMKTM